MSCAAKKPEKISGFFIVKRLIQLREIPCAQITSEMNIVKYLFKIH